MMILLATVLICMALGELRFIKFEKNKGNNDLHLTSNGLHLLVSCGSRCLSTTNCSAFEIVQNRWRCQIVPHGCTEEDGRICYRMVTPLFRRYEGTTMTINAAQPVHSQPHRGRERLLIVPSCRNIPPKEYNLQTGSLQDYHDKRLVNIKCMVFMPLTQQLLLSTVKPGRVQIYSKDGRKTIRKSHAILLAFDEKRRIIFMVKDRPYVIYRMKLDGFICVRVYRNKGRVYGLVANNEIEALYMACLKGLIVLTYDGKAINTLDKKDTYCLALDLEHGVLYYSPSFELRRIVLIEKQTELVFKHMFVATEMVYHNGSLFFIPGKKDTIFQMDINKNYTRSTIDHIYRDVQTLHIAVVTI